MKASEVRIGNWVKQPNGIIEVFTVSDSDDEGDINSYLEDEIEPIPLTEEWLIKFRFRYMGSAPTLGINESWNCGNIKIEQLQSKDLVFHGLQIKHVHQLQNLYFALTGEELGLQDT